MCGVFGYLAADGDRCDVELLAEIAINTESRGPHAWGIAWIDSDDRLRRAKAPGRISARLDVLDWLQGAKAVVGHCRYATHGDPQRNENNHPHPADGGWYVHNGVITNASVLQHSLEIEPSSECDSEILGLTIEEQPGSLLSRCASAIVRTEGQLGFLGLWSRPQRLIVARRGKPLHQYWHPSGSLYLASLPDALPVPQPLREGSVRSLTVRDGTIRTQLIEVPRCPNPEVPKSPRLSPRGRSVPSLFAKRW